MCGQNQRVMTINCRRCLMLCLVLLVVFGTVLTATPGMSAEKKKQGDGPAAEGISVKTRGFGLEFAVGADGRLYQQAVGGSEEKGKAKRFTEAFPQAGDGYFYEPALQAVH